VSDTYRQPRGPKPAIPVCARSAAANGTEIGVRAGGDHTARGAGSPATTGCAGESTSLGVHRPFRRAGPTNLAARGQPSAYPVLTPVRGPMGGFFRARANRLWPPAGPAGQAAELFHHQGRRGGQAHPGMSAGTTSPVPSSTPGPPGHQSASAISRSEPCLPLGGAPLRNGDGGWLDLARIGPSNGQVPTVFWCLSLRPRGPENAQGKPRRPGHTCQPGCQPRGVPPPTSRTPHRNAGQQRY